MTSMMHRMRLCVALCVLATALGLLWSSTPAWSWGCEGHETVAYVARAQLSSDARKQADSLLRNNPIDPKLKRLCTSAGLTRFADASTWADDVRTERPKTADWHFVDIPRGSTRNQLSTFCASGGCVTKAITDAVNMLKTGSNRAAKAEALRFLIHFAGDIHQPLHCTTNNDRGGNCVRGSLLNGKSSCTSKGKCTPNLHAIWDTNLIKSDPHFTSPKQFATHLATSFQSQIPTWQQGTTNVEDWAWESQQAAEQAAYSQLPDPIPVQNPQPVAECSDPASVFVTIPGLNETLKQPYEDAARPVIEEQLAKAGTRLAMLLNSVWP